MIAALALPEISRNPSTSCLPQVAEEDLQRVADATGAQVQTTVNSLGEGALGTCALFEERQVGAERYNLFTGEPSLLFLSGAVWLGTCCCACA